MWLMVGGYLDFLTERTSNKTAWQTISAGHILATSANRHFDRQLLYFYWADATVPIKGQRNCVLFLFLFTFSRQPLQGYRLTFSRQEQAGPLKQNDWVPSQKLRGPGLGCKLNSFQHFCQAFGLLIIEVRDSQNLYSSYY